MPKIQKRRVVDGVEMLSCTHCDQFLSRDCFYKNNSGFGTRSRCKKCESKFSGERYRLNRDKNILKKRAYDAKHRRVMVAAQKKYDKFIANTGRLVYVGKSMRDQIAYDYQRIGPSSVSSKCGIDNSSICKIVNGEKNYVRYSSAVRLLEVYDCDETRRAAFPSPADFVEEGYRWSRYYDCCKSCGMVGNTHCRDGLCSSCDSRNKSGTPAKISLSQWSLYYSRCLSCGSSEKPHKARGLCNPCLLRAIRHGTIDMYPKPTRGIGARARLENSGGK